ncbi:hypothetical protein, partial [Actinoalloteichus caeruleus]|uniref:hypothetical protein n=1 Tax=Actinoalloteichus cyanogriseus TaxID=2893586 RepID=UPI001B80D6BA
PPATGDPRGRRVRSRPAGGPVPAVLPVPVTARAGAGDVSRRARSARREGVGSPGVGFGRPAPPG